MRTCLCKLVVPRQTDLKSQLGMRRHPFVLNLPAIHGCSIVHMDKCAIVQSTITYRAFVEVCVSLPFHTARVWLWPGSDRLCGGRSGYATTGFASLRSSKKSLAITRSSQPLFGVSCLSILAVMTRVLRAAKMTKIDFPLRPGLRSESKTMMRLHRTTFLWRRWTTAWGQGKCEDS